MEPIERGMDEKEVSQVVVKWLKERGYKARALTAGQRGIDVAAYHPGTNHKWAIEAKGSTSSKKGSPRYGQTKISERAAYNGVSNAFLLAVSWTSIGILKDTSIGIAVPNDKHFEMWLERIEPASALLGIAHFRAGGNGVQVFPPSLQNNPNLSRPVELLGCPRKLHKSMRLNYGDLPPYPAD